MSFKAIREAMSEEALTLDNVLKCLPAAGVIELAAASNLSEVKTAWILEQMIYMNMVQLRRGKYTLTNAYKTEI